MHLNPALRNRSKAFAAFLRVALIGWATGLLALIELRGERRAMRGIVNKFERYLARLVVIMARQHVTPSQRFRHAGLKRPTGARLRVRRWGHAAAITRGIGLRVRGSIRERLVHVLAMLSAPERLVARVAKRLRRGIKYTWLCTGVPPARLLFTDAPARAPAIADSS